MPSENNNYWRGKHIQNFPFLLNVVMQKLNQISTVAVYVTILNTRGRLGDLDLIYYFPFSFSSSPSRMA